MKKLSFALLTLPVAVALACEKSGTPPTDYGPVLTAVEAMGSADLQAFVTRADELVTSLKALEASKDAPALSNAQSAWRGARAAYRKLDAVRVGPVVELGIADLVDAAVVQADIDAVVTGSSAIDAAAVKALPGTKKGFAGVEHLLFNEPGDATRRHTLARAMSEDIAESARKLQDAWISAKPAIGAELAGAGKTSARYPTQRAAIDDLVASLGSGIYYGAVHRMSRALGKTTGGKPEPLAEPLRASDHAVADMTATLSGVMAVYSQTGFGARIKERSASLDARVTSQLADCAGKIAAIPLPYAESLTTKTASVEAAYEACRTLRTTWDTDVTSMVGATLKPSDNDGD